MRQNKSIAFFTFTFILHLSSVLMFAKIFGIMPLSRLDSPSKRNFKLFVPGMIYCLAVEVSIAFMLVVLFYQFIDEGKSDYGELVPAIFFFNCFAISLNFIYIAKKLPELIESWTLMEFESKIDGKVKHIKTILITFMCIPFLEHLLSKATDYERASYCFENYDTPTEAFLKGIITNFFKVLNYRLSLGIYVMLTCFYSTILWNYCDIFLIIMCYIMWKYMSVLNQKVINMKHKVKAILHR